MRSSKSTPSSSIGATPTYAPGVNDHPFFSISASVALRKEAKNAVAAADKRDKKSTQAEYDERVAALTDELTIAKEAHWLYEKFGDGEYQDVVLCGIHQGDFYTYQFRHDRAIRWHSGFSAAIQTTR